MPGLEGLFLPLGHPSAGTCLQLKVEEARVGKRKSVPRSQAAALWVPGRPAVRPRSQPSRPPALSPRRRSPRRAAAHSPAEVGLFATDGPSRSLPLKLTRSGRQRLRRAACQGRRGEEGRAQAARRAWSASPVEAPSPPHSGWCPRGASWGLGGPGGLRFTLEGLGFL